MLVYLAGPIDKSRDRREMLDWRARMSEALHELPEVMVFDPAAAFQAQFRRLPPGESDMPAIAETCVSLVERADVVVLLLDGSPTVGSYIELGIAIARGVRVAVLGEAPAFVLGLSKSGRVRVCANTNEVLEFVVGG